MGTTLKILFTPLVVLPSIPLIHGRQLLLLVGHPVLMGLCRPCADQYPCNARRWETAEDCLLLFNGLRNTSFRMALSHEKFDDEPLSASSPVSIRIPLYFSPPSAVCLPGMPSFFLTPTAVFPYEATPSLLGIS